MKIAKQFWTCAMLLTLTGFGCHGQNNAITMKNTAANPLLCNPEQGLCEMPATASSATKPVQWETSNKPVRVLYFTDPICSSCWGIEPQLRRLKLEYGRDVEIEYRMGGLLPSWDVYNSGGISKPSDVAHHWDEVSRYYDMPIDGDVWLEDPLPSSYPPSIAFKAAQMQDEKKALLFLRRIREMVFLEKKNITKWEHLQQAAKETGLDSKQLETDYNGPAQQAFQEDLNLARQMGVRGFPTLFFTDTTGNRLTLYGSRPYAQFEQNVRALFPEAARQAFETSPELLFSQYPTLTTREFSELSGLSRPAAETRLRELEAQGKCAVLSTKNGSLWKWKTK